MQNDLFMRQSKTRNRSDIVREIDLDIVPAILKRLHVHQYREYNLNAMIHTARTQKMEGRGCCKILKNYGPTFGLAY
jgi:hypothetical protein